MPDKIKDYKIVKTIGKGGMGEVYLALHPTLKREIILKRLKIKGAESSKRFLQEAKIMLEFRHENIVQFYDHFKDGDSTYIVMEYVKGKALNQIIEENETVPIPIALFIIYQAALGLFHAHQKKVIHRDIKPHNILVSVTGEVKITDFGIATSSDDRVTEVKTEKNEIIGTPAYMAPEQFSKVQPITNRTDIYALGVILFEMITGVRPYKNEFSAELVASITKGDHPPLKKYIKNPPKIVTKILSKSFNPKIKKRYKTLYPLIKLLRNYFKKYNVFEIRDSIKRLILVDKKIAKSPFMETYKRKIKHENRVRIATTVIFFTTLFLTLFFSTNRHYEWLLSNKYGKIIVEFPTKDLDTGNSYLKVDRKYYLLDLKPTIKINFLNIFKSKKNNKLKIVEFLPKEIYTGSFYVEKGEREIALLSGSYKQIKRVIVSPIKVQKKDKTTKDGTKVFIPNIGIWPQEAICYFRFWDSINIKELLFKFNHYSDRELDKIKFENDSLKILYRKGYINLKDYIITMKSQKLEPFTTGNKYRFLVKDFKTDTKIYFDKYFDVIIALDERTIILHQNLVAKPAKLKIITNVKKLPVFINNEKGSLIFINGDYEYRYFDKIDYRKVGRDYIVEFYIPPQNITFKVGENGKIIKKFLKSDEDFEINVTEQNGKYIY